MSKFSANKESGFTLVEMMIVVAVIMIFLVAAGNFVISALTEQGYAIQRDKLEQDTRYALDQWVHDVRTANTGDPALTPVSNLSTTGFTFYSPDRQTPFHLRKITYALSGTNLNVSTTASTNSAPTWTFPTTSAAFSVAIKNVRSLTFTYKDANGAVTAAANKVQRVDMTMVIDNDPTRSPWSQTYAMSADLRITNG